MANTLPLNIPIPQSAAVASYNYTDIADAVGVIAFNGAVFTSGDTSNPPVAQNGYYLTTNTPYSNLVAVSGAIIAANGLDYISQNNNFDVRFNRPQNFKGFAYLNMTIGGYRPSGGSNPAMWVSGARLQNATTGVTISDSLKSEGLNLTATGGNTKTVLMRFNLTGGPYHFKAGETLRLTFDLFGTGGSTAALQYGGYGADPKNRADPFAGTQANATLSGATTTQLVLYIPSLLNTV